MEEIRINKYLSDRGVCSRREADRLVAEGRVTVEGKRAVLGQKVADDARVEVDGTPVGTKSEPVLIAVNKPAGVVSTSDPGEKANLVTYVGFPERIYPIGRLDKDSEGLILLTNQGWLADSIAHARGRHEKEYHVTVDREVTADFLEKMSAGVRIGGTVTRRCRVGKISRYRFRIILTQGMNRQIRRMCAALGYSVKQLQRVRILNVTLRDLKVGEYRFVEGDEYRELLRGLGIKE